MKIRNYAVILCLCLVLTLGACQLFYNPPTASVTINKTEFEYEEDIKISLSVESDPGKVVEVVWKLNGEQMPIKIDDPYEFTFSLTPELTTNYKIQAVITDGVETITIEKDFVVKQIPFLGTWRATAEYTPAYSSPMDIIGVWYMNGFEIYYLNANGGTEIRNYSAKGDMDFPEEDKWITLDEKLYWNESDGEWQEWTLNDGKMYAKYNFLDGKMNMTVYLNTHEPSETYQYEWNFTKVDDTVDSWE